ncbi:hypothetical protein LTR62_006308 [Meristemomyces frigidus]|uniref:Uncharacterized protein n=1 Tax=Meristemomyces frigidus TaxID=1508187 RepID=A0AAN7TNJ3_9PEZI|nr:hypothetical protein LTR62_006308 [Meristemomyces frigidus]
MADPPPPPPPPHGQSPRPPGGLPDGNYDIFIIPPHSAGSGFLYLPSMQPHRNSFLLGVACTLLAVGVWTLVMPVLKQWLLTVVASGGMGVLLLVVGVGVAGWAWGKTQGETGKGAGSGDGSTSGTGRPQWGQPEGSGPQAHGYASPPQPNEHSAPPPQTPPPRPPPPEPEPEPPKPEPPKPDPPKKSAAASGWEKAREETRKREEERRRAEELRKKREEAQKLREEAERAVRAKAEKEKWEQARAREKEQREREARERIVRERLAREKDAREAREKEAREKDTRDREAREKAAKEAAAAKLPSKPAASATSKPASRYEKPTAASYVPSEADHQTHSYRPYDKPTYKSSASSISGLSESSYAPSTSTARTTPPPSQRGPYTTTDPDKIHLKAVYLFTDSFPTKPVAQLIANTGPVTDGLILRIKTEGLFIDDDVRGVPQREWDVKAWTLKLVEDGGLQGLHVLRATVKDAESKKYTFVLEETEAWKVAVGLQKLKKGSLVQKLGMAGMKEGEVRGILGGQGWL